MRLCFLPTLLVVLILTAPAWAIDTVKTAKTSVSGSLTEMSKYTVKIKRGDREDTFPVNEIEYVRLEGEPAQLNLVRNAVNSGRYKDALDGLEKVKDDNYKTDVKQEIEFFRAISTARLALAGDGAIADAGTMMNTFVQTYTT